MLLGLLTALGINIFACTTDRIYSLYSLRKEMSFKEFFFKITPSLIHMCFLIILSGHLLSLVTGFNRDVAITTEAKNTCLAQPNIHVINRECDFYDSPEVLKGYLKQCTVYLELQKAEEMTIKQISFLKPVLWESLSFHLTMDKKAKTPALKISIKRDPGLKFILSGFTILSLLMPWYFLTLHKNTKGG